MTIDAGIVGAAGDFFSEDESVSLRHGAGSRMVFTFRKVAYLYPVEGIVLANAGRQILGHSAMLKTIPVTLGQFFVGVSTCQKYKENTGGENYK